MKRFYIFCLLASFSLEFAFADSTRELGDFFYDDAFAYNVIDENEHTCQVSDWRYTYAPDGVMTIPEMVTYKNQRFTVVKIGDNAFSSPALAKHEVTKVIMPNSILEIGNNAFGSQELIDPDKTASQTSGSFQFYDVKEIVWSQNLKRIGNNAFRLNNNYRHITLPDSLEQIGDSCLLSYGREVPNPRPGDKSTSTYYPQKTLFLGKKLSHMGANAFGNTRFANVTLSSENGVLVLDSLKGCCDPIAYEYTTYILYDSSKETLITTFSNRTNAVINTPEVNDGYIDPFEYSIEFKVPDSVKTISDYAFRPNSGIGKLYLNGNIEKLGYSSLEGIIPKGMAVIDRLNPPEVPDSGIWRPATGSDFILSIYVPASAVDTYKLTAGYNTLIYPMESIGLKSVAAEVELSADSSHRAEYAPVYNAEGILLFPNADRQYLENLTPGLYIWNGEKIIIR